VSLDAIVPEVFWPLVSVDCWPGVEAVPAIVPLVLSEPEAVVVSVLELVDVLGDVDDEDVVPAMFWFWSCVERCAVCELWSGDVELEVELVEPVEATELL